MELIDKDLLKEELNARVEVLSIPGFSDNPLMIGEKSAYLTILSFLDTHETKKVDKAAIDKACKGLEERQLEDLEVPNIEKFINDIKKATEE